MKTFAIEFKWALIFMVISLLWMVLEKLLGWHDALIDKHPIYTNLFAIVAIVSYFVAISDKKRNFYNCQITWTQGFLSGVVITIIVTLLNPVAQLITFEYITPDYFTNAIKYSIDNKVMSREQAQAYFNLKSYILQATLGGLSMGVITSAIVAFFVKSKTTLI